MKVSVISIMYNEEFILPYFLQHYSQFANRIVIYNDHSTDLTAQIAKVHPMVKLLDYPYEGLNEKEFSETFEQAAKQSKADWVYCVDADEFIYGELPETRGVVLKTTGYTMIGDTGHPNDCRKIRTPSYDKPVVFDPSLDIKFGDGRHSVNLPAQDSNLELWHYKYLSRDYYKKRAEETYPRIMDKEQMDYRIKRGLNYYDRHIGNLLHR